MTTNVKGRASRAETDEKENDMLVVTMPVYNEEAGIADFLRAIDPDFGDEPYTILAIDDRSTDRSAEVIRSVAAELRGTVLVVRNERNLGHGATCLRAYREALAVGATTVLHVDGDGQFDTGDMRVVADAVSADDVQVAQGTRANRVDPWFRKALTRIGRRLGTSRFRRRGGRRQHPLARFRGPNPDPISRAPPR